MTIIWSLACVMGALPFMGVNQIAFLPALFESTSGWTTTGISVVNVAETPRLLLLFRSITQLAGGAGFAILALSAAATSLAMGVSAAEGRTDQLAPHVRRSATIVLVLYLSYIGLGVIGLKLAGMGWFDSINHAITAVATGGFSTQPDSIGHWNNRQIEAVIVVLMLLGSVNFLIAYTALRGKLWALVRSAEVRSQAFLIFVATLLLTAVTTGTLLTTLPESAWYALFEAVSAITSTGFALHDPSYATWNDFGFLILAVLMALGGGTGSTSGGIKQLRIYVLYKSALWEVRKAFLPPHAINEPIIWQGDRKELLSDKQVRQAAQFVGIYLTILFLGSAVLTAYGHPLAQSMFEFSSALGNAGMSAGLTTAAAPDGLLWTQIFGMILGRLEIFALLIGILKLVTDARDLVIPQKAVWTR